MTAFQQCGGIVSVDAVAFILPVSSPMPAGSLIAAAVLTDDPAATVSSITDTLGNTYAQANSYSTNGVRISIWYAVNGTAGTTTLTVTLSVKTAALASVMVHTGTKDSAPLDGTQTASGTSATPSSGLVPVAGSDDVVIAAWGSESGVYSYAADAPFTIRATGANAGLLTLQVASHVGASGAETAGFFQNASAAWAGIGASFLTASPPPPPVVAPQAFEADTGLMLIDGILWLNDLPVTIPGPGRFPLPPPVPPPPLPPPPLPPGPPVPPSPPLPPAPTLQFPLLSRAATLDNPSDRRSLEMLSIMFNSLTSTGQMVQTDEDSFLIVAPGTVGPGGGFTGIAGVP